MSIYQITTESGKKYRVTTAKPTRRELPADITQQLRQKTLPGYEKTEERIAQQPDLLRKAIEMARPAPTARGGVLRLLDPTRPVRTGMAGLGGLWQRGEAAIANPLMVYQERLADVLAKPTLPNLFEFHKDVGKAQLRGITGERLGEFGDIPRRAGVPGPVSAAIGLGTMGGLANLLTGGAAGRGTQKAMAGAKRRLPRVMKEELPLRRAETIANELKKTRTSLGKEVGKIIQKSGSKKVDVKELTARLGKVRLPQSVVSSLDDPIYGIEKLPDKTYTPTVKNMHKILKALDDHMTTRSWGESSKISQTRTKEMYAIIRRAMGKAAPEINKPFTVFSNFMKNIYRPTIRTVKKTTGQIVEKPLKATLKSTGEQATKEALKRLGKESPASAQAIKDVQKYIGRQATKEGLKRAVRLGAGLGIPAYIINRIIRSALSGLDLGGGDMQQK